MRSTSLERANRAIRDGAFAAEIVAVTVKSGKGETRRRDRRAAAEGAARQDPDAEARLPRRTAR